MSDRFARWFRILCKFGVPIILATILGLMVADRLNRWPVAAAETAMPAHKRAVLLMAV